jgi:hypothetical protein
MSRYSSFAVVGAGTLGSVTLINIAAGIVRELVVLTCQVKYPSNT